MYDRAIERLIDVDKIYANIDDRCRVKIPFGEMNDNLDDIIKKAKEIEEKNKERIRSGCDYAY